MNNDKVLKELDKTIENFKKDMALFEKGSSKPVTENDLYNLSVMVLNALGDVKKAFE